MKKTTLILSCLLFATPVLAQSVSERTGINSALGVAPKTADFVKQVTISDMFEIQSSKIAAQKLTGPAKAFAEQMIADHTKTSTQLTAAAKVENIPLPAEMDSKHQEMIARLNGASTNDLQKRYIDDQVSAHKDAVDLFERYSNGGDDAKLKAWAASTLPALRHHLEMAQNLDKQM